MKNSQVTRRHFLKWSVRGGICSLIAYPTLIEPNWPLLQKVTVPIKNLPENLTNLKIGLLADFHRGLFVSDTYIEKAVSMLQKEGPDLICVVGDFVEGEAEYVKPVARMLSQLVAPLGIFAVLGNHDYWTDPQLIQTTLEKSGIPVLKNRAIEVQSNGASFYIAGLDDAWEGRPDYRKTLQDVPADKMVILLVHEPDYADMIRPAKKWVPLQLSGHSHGGQVVVPFLGAPVLPYMAKKYHTGLYQAGNNRFVYTSRGIGSVMPFRLNCRPEVNLLTLHRS